MLHFFRQHRQLFGLALMPALLLVWLAFSCQNCFADTSESAQQLHAAMDCCPSTAHSEHARGDMGDNADKQGCDTNYLVNQPMLTDEGAIQLADFVDVLLPVAEARFAAVYPTLIQPTGLDINPQYFSDRLFSSYRILLI